MNELLTYYISKLELSNFYTYRYPMLILDN